MASEKRELDAALALLDLQASCKREVEEHKMFLERQDQQVKNVLQLCMRTIKEIKSDQYLSSKIKNLQLKLPGQQNGLPYLKANSEDNGSDDRDTEVQLNTQQSKITKYIDQTHHQTIRYEPNIYHKREIQSPATNQRQSMTSSTPLPTKKKQENIDQGTQTDNAWFDPPIAKIEEMELVLKRLYERFQSLVMRVNSSTNRTIKVLENEHNDGVSTEPNYSWIAPNNVTESVGTGNHVEDNNVITGDIGAELVEAVNESVDAKLPVKLESSRKTSNECTRVRRMSAQTTNSNEMVPIGNGHATVPVRLLNEIDWTSHTTATRQLLQAIFPRKVLATHSLTGKQSPAHLHKPAKKILDRNLVEDIIITVSTKSRVPKNLVRNTITVKCTDEAKLYRNRQRYRFTRNEMRHENNENVPLPLMYFSYESCH